VNLYSYIFEHDTGSSPNPFWGYCTLAEYKSWIRRSAEVGDWIVGLRRKAGENRLVYAMQVEEIIPYDQYYQDSRFAAKIPDYIKGEFVHRCGDNIYDRLGFKQIQYIFSNTTSEDPDNRKPALRGEYVLVSKTFYYFGSRPLRFPKTLNELKFSEGSRSIFSPDIIPIFTSFISGLTPGVNAKPASWPDNDDSWKTMK
jgi:hypothetical protein